MEKFFIASDSDQLDLEVKQSQILNAGKGLYAKRKFNKNEIVAEYRGSIFYTKDCTNPIFDYAERMTYINQTYSMIGTSIASYANDIIVFDIDKYKSDEYQLWILKKKFPLHTGFQYNCQIKIKKNKVFLVTIKNIEPGEEMFTQYGFEYWRWFYEKLGEDQLNQKQTQSQQSR